MPRLLGLRAPPEPALAFMPDIGAGRGHPGMTGESSPREGEELHVGGGEGWRLAGEFRDSAMRWGAGDPAAEGRDIVISAARRRTVAQ